MPAREAVPITVPSVSNKSIKQKVTTRVSAVNQPSFAKVAKLNLNKVSELKSLKAGSHEAVASEANGFIWKKIASPAQ